jgi:hypothetical protein
MIGRPAATWLAILGCGCEAPVPSEPKIGTYLTCINDIRHQTSYRIEGAVPVAVEVVSPSGPSVQLELFAVPAPDATAGVPHGRRRVARRPPAHAPWVETVEVAGGIL